MLESHPEPLEPSIPATPSPPPTLQAILVNPARPRNPISPVSRNVDPELKKKLQRLETKKRVALDAEVPARAG